MAAHTHTRPTEKGEQNDNKREKNVNRHPLGIALVVAPSQSTAVCFANDDDDFDVLSQPGPESWTGSAKRA